MRKLTLLHTDSCNGDTCPALYETDGGYVVQGTVLDAETAATLHNRADDEAGVFIPSHIIDLAIEARLSARAGS